MLFIFCTPVSRHMWQLKTVVFVHRSLCALFRLVYNMSKFALSEWVSKDSKKYSAYLKPTNLS